MKKHYDILFLAMSCNDPFFEMSRKVVHDTWAKDIIEGKYSGVGFFSYTSSNSFAEYVKDNCIYVDVPDDISHTYSKTIKAMKMLKDHDISWDCIVRTNTSTYINVQNMIEFINNVKFYARQSGEQDMGLVSFHAFDLITNSAPCPLPAGWLMCASERFTDLLISKFDELNEDKPEQLIHVLKQHASVNDDVLFGVFRSYLNETLGLNIAFIEMNGDMYVKHYKSFINNPFIQSPLEREGLYKGHQHTDPADICDAIAMQVRLPGVKNEYRYIELEHMYELHNAYKNKN